MEKIPPFKTELACILATAKQVTEDNRLCELGSESLLYAIACHPYLLGHKTLTKAGVDTHTLKNVLIKRLATQAKIGDGEGFSISNAAEGLFALAKMERCELKHRPLNSNDLLRSILKNDNTAAARLLKALNVTCSVMETF